MSRRFWLSPCHGLADDFEFHSAWIDHLAAVSALMARMEIREDLGREDAQAALNVSTSLLVLSLLIEGDDG